MKRKLIFLLCALLTSVGMWAQETPVNDGVYYIYNEANDLFLTRGQSWGTQAVAKPVGLPWKVSITDGKYTLRMYDLTVAGSTSGFGSNAYTDNGSPITFTPSGNASGGFTLQNGDSYITCPNSAGAVSLSATSSSWKFLTQAQYDAALAARVAAQESAIATLKGISIPDGQSLNDVVTDGDNWRTSATVNDGVPTSSKWSANKDGARGGNTNWGDYGTEMYQCGNAHYTRTITGLTKGIYKVTVRGMKRVGWNEGCSTMGDAGYPVSDAYLSANGYIIRMKAWYEDRTDASNPNSTGSFVTIVNNGGYTTEGFVYVGDDGELVLDAGSEAYWGGSWFLFNGISYTYYDNSVSDDDVNALIATIPAHVSDAHVSAMESAKTTLQGSKTIANYNALVAAIEAAQTSANEYAIIDAGTVPTNNIAGWAKSTTNGTLACNTWSTEGNTDGSGMTTPFIQDWVGSGTPLAGGNAGGKLYYSFTDLNPGETYVVTARVRVFNEASTGVTGATYFVGSSTKPLDATFSSPCVGDFAAKGRFAVLSCAGTVDSNGDLQFGIELADDSPINWISIKDVTIAAGTGDVPTAIEMNKTAVTLTTGGSETLTATITPATADDKTTLWTSSDETVATVSGGTVVALKAGTATITATAYAGTSVEATCTVTVTDAAAPSYYSTTIAAGDYYIYNAATGMFLGGGNSWGTQASLIEHGIPFTVGVGEGVYTLDSHTYNNETDHFFNGTYVDGASTNLYITSLGSGKFAISTAASSAYAAALPGSTVVANSAANSDSPLAQWYFLSKNDRDKTLAAATALNPVDATYYIKQANISRNLSAGAYNVNAWSQYSVDGTQDNTNHAAQVYNATVDNKQVIENIPNGTYKVTVQAFTSGTDVKFYANNEKVDVKNNDSGAASCSAAAALFAQDLYPNTVTVTVTDRTLTLGFEGDCSGAKWLCYDKFEMEMTSYTANTGVSASIDKSEIQIGQTANITAATVPATASFNAITRYVSSDEGVATVDANGVVTGVGVGDATITVYAEEMESFSNTVDVSVTLVYPTALAMSEEAVTLQGSTLTTTLTVTPTPVGANDAVTWTSSNESVATVSNGVVTAVSSGTATITATSVVDGTVSTTATVKVFAVKNGSFETDGLMAAGNGTTPKLITPTGWTQTQTTPNSYQDNQIRNATTANASNYGTLVTPSDGDYYLFYRHGWNGDNHAVFTSDGESLPMGNYTLTVDYKMVSGSDNTTNNTNTSITLTAKSGETTIVSKTANDAVAVNNNGSTAVLKDNAWTTLSTDFSLTEAKTVKVVIDMRACGPKRSDFVVDNVTLTYNGLKPMLLEKLTEANDVDKTTNVGAGVFQIPTSAASTFSTAIDDAQAVYDNGSATDETVVASYNALGTAITNFQNAELNAPAVDTRYFIECATSGHAKENNAVIVIPGATGANNPTGYAMNANFAPAQYLAQAFIFTKVSGNTYKISIERPEATVYLTNGTKNGSAAGWKASQIQGTTDAEKAMAFEIMAADVDGTFYIQNTETNSTVAIQTGGNVYTEAGNAYFRLAVASEAEVTVKPKAGKYSTAIFPFTPTLPSGVKAYSCGANVGATLTLTEEVSPAANTPYILENTTEADINETLSGYGTAAAASYEAGYLTGLYTNATVEAGNYVLQTKSGKQGFYKLDSELTGTPYRAYMTVPAASIRAFYFDDADGLTRVVSTEEGNEVIYNLAGQRLQKAKRGVNIINGKKVVVK